MERPPQALGRGVPDHPRRRGADALDPAARRVASEVPPAALDVGKLGHAVTSSPPGQCIGGRSVVGCATVRETVPGVYTWTNVHPRIGIEVSSHWVPAARAVIDPLLADHQGLDAFAEDPPQRVLLTNRHHLRSAERFAEELGCTISCHRAGLHEFEGGPEVVGFDWGEEVSPGIEALEVDAICEEETALLIVEARALSIADAIIGYGGKLAFVPDGLLGEDPEGVKRGIRAAFARLLERDFDSLLLAHGDPVARDGKRALRELCEGDGS
jgi:hypothetical protein